MNPTQLETAALYDEREIQRQRLFWLIRIRWYAATALLLVGMISLFIDSLFFQGEVLCAFSVLMYGYNYYFWRQIQEPDYPLSNALMQVLSDIIVLTLILFFTGGFKNPFFTFYFSIVIIAWMVLSYRLSIFVTVLVTLCFAVQGLSWFSTDLKLFGELPMHVIGAPVSFVITTVVTAYFVYIIMEDLRRREEDVKHARQQSMQAQRLAAVGQLAAGVAHEINTPLGTINLVANDALDVMTDKPRPDASDLKDVQESLLTIKEQTNRCKNITKTLLEFSRKPTVERELCTLNDIVDVALDICRHKMNGIAIETALDSKIPSLYIDRNGMERAVCNLLLNAVDALDATNENAAICIETTLVDQQVQLQVRDTGCGMTEESLSRIFEPFYTTKEVGKGTGLGLYITYGIIQDAGGTLEITSEPGKGTNAVIAIPVQGETD